MIGSTIPDHTGFYRTLVERCKSCNVLKKLKKSTSFWEKLKKTGIVFLLNVVEVLLIICLQDAIINKGHKNFVIEKSLLFIKIPFYTEKY